jgi:hypothetical protein
MTLSSHVGAGARIDERAQEQDSAENDKNEVEHGLIPMNWSAVKMGRRPVKPRDGFGATGIKNA